MGRTPAWEALGAPQAPPEDPKAASEGPRESLKNVKTFILCEKRIINILRLKNNVFWTCTFRLNAASHSGG